MKKRERLVIFIVPLLILAWSILTVLGVMTSKDSILNEFRTADLRGEIEETFSEPDGWEPEQQYDKVVNVTNNSNQPVYVRVKLFPQIIKEEGLIITTEGAVLLPCNTEGTPPFWIDGGDGYYYYLRVLGPGQKTEEPLLRAAAVGAAGTDYDGAELEIHVISETCQTVNNAHRTIWWQGELPASGSIYAEIEAALKAGG